MLQHLGIQQPQVEEVTGTIILLDDNPSNTSIQDADSMKKGSNGVILSPQPHDSPNDPLNWPIWKRDICLFVIGFQSFIGGGQSPLLAAGFSSLSKEFNKNLSTISYLVGGLMLSLGFGSVVASPTAVLYGKRLVYLGGILLFLAGSIWAGASKDFPNLMGARVITGFGASPTESLPSATIAEIYFAHERAYRVGIYTMLLLGGKNIIPLLSSLIFAHLDRHWLFYIQAMFLGFNLLLTFLFVPDTFWDREPIPTKRTLEETNQARKNSHYHPPESRPFAFAVRRPTRDTINFEIDPVCLTAEKVESNKNHVIDHQKVTYFEEIKLYRGKQSNDSWWMVALRPFFLYTYPSILFGSFIYSFAVVWLIVISETIADIFESPAYNYSAQTVGLFYISPFIGGILGSLAAGLISDRLSRFLIRINKGKYEPEFRLFMLIPSTFFISLGLMGYGWSSQNHDLWVGPVIFFGCVAFGSSMASTTAITFAVDSYKVFAAEALVSFNFLKNLIGFIFSLFNNKFINNIGSRDSFVVYGCIQLFVALFGIPLYIYGKRIRAWTDKKELLKSLYKVDKVEKVEKVELTNNANKNSDDSNDNTIVNCDTIDRVQNSSNDTAMNVRIEQDIGEDVLIQNANSSLLRNINSNGNVSDIK